MSSKGKLFVISGPSGAGKGTIIRELISQIDVRLSISATTRKPRPGEIHGVSYYFVEKEEFMDLLQKGEFLEHAKVYENFYGTPKTKVLEQLDQGYDVILEIDIQGAMKVKEVFHKAVFIFILPPSMSELRRRITGRGSETEDVIDLRMSKTLSELSFIDQYDYCVVNGQVQEAVNRVKAIITAEHSKVSSDIQLILENFEEEK
ncbi:guanylate kinase [Eubacteriales bacterium KG127]